LRTALGYTFPRDVCRRPRKEIVDFSHEQAMYEDVFRVGAAMARSKALATEGRWPTVPGL